MPVSRQRRRKQFGLPVTHRMDREWAHRLRLYARAWSAAHRRPGQHRPGPITRACSEVLNALIGFAGRRTGACYPSYAAIAARARCTESTVGVALAVLEQAGIIRIINRLTRDGNRVLRTSNAYVFKDLAPNTENRPGNLRSKESVDLLPVKPARAAPEVADQPPKLDESHPMYAVLVRLGRTAGFRTP